MNLEDPQLNNRDDEETFDLDVRFAENGPVLTELMNATSDNCGSTGASACVTCAAVS